MAKKTTQTVRERTESGSKAPKKRRVRNTAKTAWKPIALVGQGLKIIFSPFKFVLKPFKTKPMRAVGRFLAKVLLINYFINSFRELRQVTWPNRKETINLTFAVLMFSLVFGSVVALVDYGFDKLFQKILIK